MADQTVFLNFARPGGSTLPAYQPTSKPAAPRAQPSGREAAPKEIAEQPDRKVDNTPDLTADSVRIVRDEKTGRSLVHVLDRRTGEVIYQIPPEEVQKLAEILDEMIGSVVNTVA